jgi:uncharacterized protein (TIGR02145 family)
MFLFFTVTLAQDAKLNVHLKDGSINNLTIAEIDSITFTVNSGNLCNGVTSVDYEGKTYTTVEIGNRCWFKENLNVGIMVEGINHLSNNDVLEKYCYGDDESNCESLGALYQWGEAMQYVANEGAQGICPTSWHIPSMVDMQELFNTVNGSGNALKDIGVGSGDGVGTDISGFSALLAGYRDDLYGMFNDQNNNTSFWISNETTISSAKYLGLISNYDNIIFNETSKNNGYSVRCVKD